MDGGASLKRLAFRRHGVSVCAMVLLTSFRRFVPAAALAAALAAIAVGSPVATTEWLSIFSGAAWLLGLMAVGVSSWRSGVTTRGYRTERLIFARHARNLAMTQAGLFRGGQVVAIAMALSVATVLSLVLPGHALLAPGLTLALAVVFSAVPHVFVLRTDADAGLLAFVCAEHCVGEHDGNSLFLTAWRFADRLHAAREVVALGRHGHGKPDAPARDFLTALDSGGTVRPSLQSPIFDPLGVGRLRLRGLRPVCAATLPFAFLAWLVSLLVPLAALPPLPVPSDFIARWQDEQAEAQQEDRPEEEGSSDESGDTDTEGAGADGAGGGQSGDGEAGADGAGEGGAGSGGRENGNGAAGQGGAEGNGNGAEASGGGDSQSGKGEAGTSQDGRGQDGGSQDGARGADGDPAGSQGNDAGAQAQDQGGHGSDVEQDSGDSGPGADGQENGTQGDQDGPSNGAEPGQQGDSGQGPGTEQSPDAGAEFSGTPADAASQGAPGDGSSSASPGADGPPPQDGQGTDAGGEEPSGGQIAELPGASSANPAPATPTSGVDTGAPNTAEPAGDPASQVPPGQSATSGTGAEDRAEDGAHVTDMRLGERSATEDDTGRVALPDTGNEDGAEMPAVTVDAHTPGDNLLDVTTGGALFSEAGDALPLIERSLDPPLPEDLPALPHTPARQRVPAWIGELLTIEPREN